MQDVLHAVLPFVVLAQSAQQPDTSVRVSVQQPAMPVSRLLAQVSEQTKVPLEASIQVAPDVVFVDAKDVSLSDLMDRIALADAAEWVFENGKYRLKPAVGKRNQEAKTDADRAAMAARREIDKNLHPETQKNGPNAEVLNALRNANKMVFRLLELVNPADIGSVGVEERVVFATSPTAVQRRLSGNAMAIAQEWVAQHNKEVAGMKQDPEEALNKAFGGETPQMYKDLLKNRTSAITQPVAKVLLIVEKNSLLMGSTTVEARLYSPQGKVLKQEQANLGIEEILELASELQGNKTPEAPTTNTPIEWSTETKALDKIRSAMRTDNFSLEVPNELREKLLHPEQFDPLAFHATDALRAYAKATKKPLVAVIPDDMTFSVMGGWRCNSVEEFGTQLTAPDGLLRVKPDVNWTVLSPSRPVTTRSKRITRMDLARLVKAGTSRQGARLDDIAAYAVRNPSPMDNQAAMPYVLAFAPNAIGASIAQGGNWPMYRFFGSLDVSVRSACRQGSTIPLNALNFNQMRLVNAMAFGPNARLSVSKPGVPEKNDDDPFGFLTSMIAGSSDFESEPTEVLPNGISPHGSITVEAINDNFVKPAKSGGGSGFGYSLGADELAMVRMFKETPAYSAYTAQMKLPTEGTHGQRVTLRFRFNLAPGVSVRQSLNDDFIPDGAPTVKLDALPDAFAKRIDAKLAAMKKGPMGMAGALLGGAKKTQGTP